MLKNLFCLLCILLFEIAYTVAVAQNPFITHMYTADPTARVFNGRLYVYPSHDVGYCQPGQGDNNYCMPDYHVFSTSDLVNWTDHGKIIDQRDVPWGVHDAFGMWAPDCIEKGGKYYHFFPGVPRDRSAFRRMGIAVADRPEGPFRVLPNYLPGVKGFDPGLFKDDDGKVYLYYIHDGVLRGVRLADNMQQTIGNVVDIPMPDGYKEGPFTFKRNGIYYFTFAHVPDRNGIRAYEIGYATSRSPLGPFTYRGTVMPRVRFNHYDTNHASFVSFKGKWYIFYHHWLLSENNRLRSIRADEITFNADGTIRMKEATIRGVGVPKVGDLIQIDRHNGISGAQTHFVQGNAAKGFQVDYITNNSWVRFNKVDFGNGQNLGTFSASVATQNVGGQIEVRIGSVNGQLLANIPVTYTGGWGNWRTVSAPFLSITSGVKDIVCVFKGTGGYLFNVDWLKFSNRFSASNPALRLSSVPNPLRVYVNPALQTISLSQASQKVCVYDICGVKVLETGAIEERKPIDISGLDRGVYIVKTGYKQQAKFIKQ